MTTQLKAAGVDVTIDEDNGCRVVGLRVDGVELLRQGPGYGSFPMVPWCGRIADGRFQDGATTHQMPVNHPPHAIHGFGRDAAWTPVRPASGQDTDRSVAFYWDLAEPWPYRGRVTQIFELSETALTMTLGIETHEDSFPAQAGWHPWFLRDLGQGGGEVRIDFRPEWQEERGEDHLPTGARVEPGPGPWDDCFGMPYGVDVTLTWPETLELRITSRAEWVVVYDEQPEAVCVEPQTGPPNGLNTQPRLVTPVDPLEVSATWTWRRP
ncbi:aldose 1-epimerase [Streptomyces sp. BI20]|uniref:aldose epimerase family protein n=1 Tax=Streptomyces sp. BI20 TaxID=3403460 RepID=UPI003C745F83